MKVYKAISEVQSALAETGISKGRSNQMQGYKFRGIDDVYNALCRLLPEHNLVILPRIISREQVERVNHKGSSIFYTTVEAEFDFVHAEDGSKHTVKMFGEAMDSSDKSTNKAMSAAYKYACLQTFCIPTEGDNDADSSHHEVVRTKKQSPDFDGIQPGDVMIALDNAKTEEELLDLWKTKVKAASFDEKTVSEFKEMFSIKKSKILEDKLFGSAA